MLAKYSICTQSTKCFEKSKGANINVGNIPYKLVFMKFCFLIRKPTLNSDYLLHLLIIFTCQFK